MKISDFEIVRVVGKGYMGKVMIVREIETRLIYALKTIHKRAIVERQEQQHMQSERDILADLHEHPSPSPFIVRFFGAFQDRANIYYLLEYHGGGDLAGLLAENMRLPESWVRFYAAEMVQALGELHLRGIVYRDLKPENVLISAQGHVVLTDFGLSKRVPGGVTTATFCGTPEYLAPEVLMKRPYRTPIDLWSLGVLLYEMLIGIVRILVLIFIVDTVLGRTNHANVQQDCLQRVFDTLSR